MSQITPDVVAKLRDMTNAGFLTCKKALEEAKGDLNLAVEILRKQNKDAEAQTVEADFKESWKHADTPLSVGSYTSAQPVV